MDAGVLQLHVFEHDAAYQPMKLKQGDSIEPTLLVEHEITHTAAVSFIVPSFYNRSLKCGSLEHLLSGITHARCIREVVLVAADGDVESLEQLRRCVGEIPLKVVECAPERRALSRNVGAEAASHNVLMYLDDDMLLSDWRIIDVILSELLSAEYDCALFPRRTYLRFPLLYENGKFEDALARWKTDVNALPSEELLDPVKHGSVFKTMAFCFPGCFMMITRDAFDRIGRFPEDYQGWGFEDTDFAMRAVSQLKVLNLFRRVHPLAHIDHPVSPYKSEEYQKNLSQFYGFYNPLDMDWLCRRVFTGDDFQESLDLEENHREYLEPMREVVANYLPIREDTVLRNYEHVLLERLKHGLTPIPEIVTLHGSRGAGTATAHSDFDVLFLFRGGGPAEHFTCRDESSEVEFEYTDFAKYERFATAPALYAMRGPLELAKLAQSRVLWGDAESFTRWRLRVLTAAAKIGLPIWCLSAIGLHLKQSRSYVFLQQYFQAIQQIMATPAMPSVIELLSQADEDAQIEHASLFGMADDDCGIDFKRSLFEQFQLDPELLDERRIPEFVSYTLSLLDRELSDWRADMADSKRVFAHQIPELWSALRYVLADEATAEGALCTSST